MSSPCRLALLLAILAWPGTTVARINGFDAEYQLSRGPLTVGRMKRSLHIDAESDYVFASRIEPRGLVSLFAGGDIVEQSRGRIVDNRFVPHAYRYDAKGHKRDFTLRFDQGSNTVARSDGTDWHADMPRGLLDKLSYQAQLMLDLADVPATLDYPIADKGKLKRYLITNEGSAVVDTPLGRFDTVLLQRADDDSPRRTRVWCARKLGWIPVRVEHRDKHGDVTIAVISELRIDPPPAH